MTKYMRGEVGVQHPLPLLMVKLSESPMADDTRVVHQHVEAAKALAHTGEESFDRRRIADIAADELAAVAVEHRAQFGGGRRLPRMTGNDGRSLLDERERDRAADPARAPGDEDALAAQTEIERHVGRPRFRADGDVEDLAVHAAAPERTHRGGEFAVDRGVLPRMEGSRAIPLAEQDVAAFVGGVAQQLVFDVAGRAAHGGGDLRVSGLELGLPAVGDRGKDHDPSGHGEPPVVSGHGQRAPSARGDTRRRVARDDGRSSSPTRAMPESSP